MKHYNVAYSKLIDDKNRILPSKMKRGNFYLIKEYNYIDGHKGKFQELKAPVIFTLFVSRAQDIVHCIKVSDINPNLVKKFFGKLLDEETNKIKIKGSSKLIYERILSKMPIVSTDSYRTYKLSGITKVLELKLDQSEIIPESKLKEKNYKKDKK